MGSQPGGGHESPVIDWIAVYTMVAGTILLGLALPLKSWWLAGGGAIVFVVGAGIALGYGIMNHTEDYEVTRRPPSETDKADETTAAKPGHRIISA